MISKQNCKHSLCQLHNRLVANHILNTFIIIRIYDTRPLVKYTRDLVKALGHNERRRRGVGTQGRLRQWLRIECCPKGLRAHQVSRWHGRMPDRSPHIVPGPRRSRNARSGRVLREWCLSSTVHCPPSTIQYLLLGDVLPSQKKDIGPCDSTPLPLEVGVPAPKSPAKRMISWKKRVLPMHHRVANPARNSKPMDRLSGSQRHQPRSGVLEVGFARGSPSQDDVAGHGLACPRSGCRPKAGSASKNYTTGTRTPANIRFRVQGSVSPTSTPIPRKPPTSNPKP